MVVAIRDRIDRTDSLYGPEFHSYLLPFFEAIGDGHTHLYSLNLPDRTIPIFSIRISIPNDSTLIAEESVRTSDCRIPKGSVIDSINGRSAREIIREMVRFRPCELMHFRLNYISSRFSQYYWFLYRDTTFRVQAAAPDGTLYRTEFPGIPYQDWRSTASQSKPAALSPFRLDILSDTVAVMDFQRMWDQYKASFGQFLDSTFRQLRKRRIPNLIIDIRKNGGGNTALGDSLLRYLSSKPFTQFGAMFIKHSPQAVLDRMDDYIEEYPEGYTPRR